MARVIGTCLGAVLIVIGLPLLVTPIPAGAALIALGVFVLVLSSPHAAALVRALRGRFKSFDHSLHALETRSPGFLARILSSTRPRPTKRE